MKPYLLKILASSLLLAACTPFIANTTVDAPLASGLTGAHRLSSSKQISGYVMQVAATFKVQAVDDLHTQLIQSNVADFEKDLAEGQLDDYYKLPDFSIQLLAHSEGSYFTSPGNLNEFVNNEAAFARALVIYPDQSYDIFKGQFANQRFYFSGSESLSLDNTSYLITLDQNLNTRVVTGQLQVQSKTLTSSATPLESSAPVVLPSPAILPTATPSATSTTSPSRANPSALPPPPPPPEQRYAQALEQYRQRSDGFSDQVSRFVPGQPPPPPPPKGQFAPPPQPVPPPPDGQQPPPPNGQQPPPGPLDANIMARLRSERPAVAAEIDALIGLPPQEHYAQLLKIQERNSDLIPALGPPPPDGPGPNPPQPSPSGRP
jgi:hypothetical protein